MKISELLRGLAELIDQENQGPTMSVQINAPADTTTTEIPQQDELARMRILSGLIGTGDTQYSNSPEEMVGTIANVTASGTDLNKSKDPADIRTNAPSMFPGFQAGMK
jgi:hypothetical protein